LTQRKRRAKINNETTAGTEKFCNVKDFAIVGDELDMPKRRFNNLKTATAPVSLLRSLSVCEE
jgi:hypothetical protein